jgi:hypothetical protein
LGERGKGLRLRAASANEWLPKRVLPCRSVPAAESGCFFLHRSAASAPCHCHCHAHAHPHHHSNNHIHHDHQPRVYQANLPLYETGPVSHGITGDRIPSARQGRDLGDGAGSKFREKDTKKTGTTQACGSSSLPRTLTHRLSYCHRQRLLN